MTAILSAALMLTAMDAARLQDLTDQWQRGDQPMLTGFHNLYNPHVIHEPGAQYPFKMWFFGYAAQEHNPGYPGGDAIFFARAKTLDTWEVYAGEAGWEKDARPQNYVPVLYPDPEAYDNMASGDPSVVRRDGTYYMAYSGVRFDTREDEKGQGHLYNVSCVMGATSPDGIHWTRTAEPILRWEQELDCPWEIIDGKIPPAPEGFMGSYHRPSMLWDNDRWRVWFDYFLPGTFVSMGCAENTGEFTNPKEWQVVQADEKPLLKDWPNTAVVKGGGTYYAFSDAPNYPVEMGGDSRQLTMATSPDGLEWTVQGHIRPDGLASSHVPEALVLEVDGETRLYLFYSWKPARKEGEEWDFRYKELRYLWKVLPSEN